MRALLEQVHSRSHRRGQFSVYQFQKTYALWLGLVLFIYSVLLFGFAFAAPFVLPALKLVAPLPLEERALAARQLLVLGQTLWPALVALILAAAVFSLYLTHRLAGPLSHLHQSTRELAAVVNEALANLEQAFGEIRARGHARRAAVGQVVQELRAQPAASAEHLPHLEGALKGSEHLEDILQRFRFAEPR